MSPAQHKRYLRYWNAAWRAHWTGVRHGEPLARPDRGPSSIRDQVVGVAGSLAGQTGGRLTPDLLRHACHIIALGRNPSSKSLTNKQQDLVIAIFQRLAEGQEELAGQIRTDQRETEVHRRATAGTDWQKARPDADRARVLVGIERSGYPLPAIERISADSYGTTNWRGLPDEQLLQLAITIKARVETRRRIERERGICHVAS